MPRQPIPPRKVAADPIRRHRVGDMMNLGDQRTPVPVVCAVIENGAGQVLVAQRPAHKHLPLKWEFAGGKVERGESPETAIVREIREELACELVVIRSLPRFVHDYGTVAIEMIPFVCRLADGSPAPHPHEHVAARWVTPPELDQIDLAAADLPVVAGYRAQGK